MGTKMANVPATFVPWLIVCPIFEHHAQDSVNAFADVVLEGWATDVHLRGNFLSGVFSRDLEEAGQRPRDGGAGLVSELGLYPQLGGRDESPVRRHYS
jgi:hypothetical protein